MSECFVKKYYYQILLYYIILVLLYIVNILLYVVNDFILCTPLFSDVLLESKVSSRGAMKSWSRTVLRKKCWSWEFHDFLLALTNILRAVN